MRTEIPAALRKLVTERASGRCEYCLLPQFASAFEHEPDHIIPVQHGGSTETDNLALACMRCNRHKGPNVGSFDPETGLLVHYPTQESLSECQQQNREIQSKITLWCRASWEKLEKGQKSRQLAGL